MVTEYLLDMQPGLYKVIAADDGTDVNRFLHDITGLAQHENNSGDWHWMAKDGLGTVRGVYDDTLTEVYAADRDPYGDLIASTGSNPTPFEYTGEPEDQNGLLHLRARYYDPNLAVFNNLDPVETANRYAYVNGNPVNNADPSGLFGQADLAKGFSAASCAFAQVTLVPPTSCDDCEVVASSGATPEAMTWMRTYSEDCALLCNQARCLIRANRNQTIVAYLDPRDAYNGNRTSTSTAFDTISGGTSLAVHGRWGGDVNHPNPEIANNIVQVSYGGGSFRFWIDSSSGISSIAGNCEENLFLIPETDPREECLQSGSSPESCIDLYNDTEQEILAHVIASESCRIGPQGLLNVARIIENRAFGRDRVVSAVMGEERDVENPNRRYTFSGIWHDVSRNTDCWQQAMTLADQLLNRQSLSLDGITPSIGSNAWFYCSGLASDPGFASAPQIGFDISADGTTRQIYRSSDQDACED